MVPEKRPAVAVAKKLQGAREWIEAATHQPATIAEATMIEVVLAAIEKAMVRQTGEQTDLGNKYA
jgi:hypothetical protein